MYVIGTVAMIAGVTVRTLRHYDDLGLLRPSWVDPRSGYRWYRPDQLHRLHRILALRDLGFTLSEIADALAGDTADSLQETLFTKRADLEERISADIRKLARVDARLALMEEGAMTDYDVIVKTLPAQRVILAQERVGSVGHIGHTELNLFARIRSIMEANKLEPVGPTIATCLFTDEDPPVIVGAAVPIDDNASLSPTKDVEIVELPAVTRAATTVINGQPKFDEGFGMLGRWAQDAGERTMGPNRTVYHDCSGPQSEWVVELQAPLGIRE